jgi:hypothetical protein
MKARDLMTPRTHFVIPDEPVLRAAELIATTTSAPFPWWMIRTA